MDATSAERNRCARALVVLLAGAGLSGAAAAEISYSNFNTTEGLNLLGIAGTTIDPFGSGSGVLRLTSATESTVGAVWAKDKFNVEQNWQASFSFRVSTMGGPNGVNDLAGADGLAFVIQNESDALYANNSSTLGGGIGYNQLGRLIAIEFDTWMNDRANDPDGNHISIQAPGTGLNTTSHHDDSRGATSLIPDMSDGTLHFATVSYINGILSVGLDGTESPLLSVAIDLGAELGLTDGRAFVGFTSATGGCWENHDLYDWTMTAVPAPASGGLLAVAGIVACRRRRR